MLKKVLRNKWMGFKYFIYLGWGFDFSIQTKYLLIITKYLVIELKASFVERNLNFACYLFFFHNWGFFYIYGDYS